MMPSTLVYFSLLVDVIRNDIGREGDDSNPETGEHLPEHELVRENWVLPPRLALRPRVPIQLHRWRTVWVD